MAKALESCRKLSILSSLEVEITAPLWLVFSHEYNVEYGILDAVLRNLVPFQNHH